MTDGGERTGKLVDFNVIQTSPGNEYPIIRSTMRKPDWGTYCPHGLKVVERVPTEHSCQSRESLPGATAWDWDEPVPCTGCYPDGQIVEPWPCDAPDCTRERFDLAMEAEVEEYWESISQLISQQYD